LKIAVNTRLLLKNRLEGIGWFSYETLKIITKQHPEHHFYFIFDRPYDEEFIFASNITPIVLFPQARHPFLFVIWFEISVRRCLKKIGADIFLSPDGYLSLSSKIKTLTVIHDLNFEHYPESLPWLIRKYYKYFFPRFARRADRIATVSEFSKNDIISKYKIAAEKIDVVYDGVHKVFSPLPEDKKSLVKTKFTSGNDYFVFVGALHPRKNICRLLISFNKFKETISEKNSNTKLVIVGEAMFMTLAMENTFNKLKYKNDVIFVGRLSPEELHLAMGAAIALVFVPYFEGFGMPILEAMNCDTPVITSNVTSMPEVSGDAALLVDPFSVDEISNAMSKIITNQHLRMDLIEKGRRRRLDFSWEKTADKLWKAIINC